MQPSETLSKMWSCICLPHSPDAAHTPSVPHFWELNISQKATNAQIAFTDEGAGYLGMCPPADVRRNLSSFFPDIEIAYRNSLPLPAGPNGHKSTKQASALAAAPTPASNMRVQAGIQSSLHKSLIRRYL